MNDKKLIKTKIVNCDIDLIWWKWTTHQGLKTFFGAYNEIELKIDGKYEIFFLMDNPVGEKGGEGNKILSYLPNKMLSFTWNAPPEYSFVRNHLHKTWVVVEFKEIDTHKIEICLTHLGWLDGNEWEEVFNYFDNAWERVLESLNQSCN
ncbi:MAG: SRPBCC domain-containing protein [Spirochaetaceae bacterium]